MIFFSSWKHSFCLPIPDHYIYIYIDYREIDFINFIEEWLIDQLRQGLKPIFDIDILELAIGDVQVSDNHVFEIKRISKQYNPHEQHNNNDLQSSLWDGRLYEQTIQRQAFNWMGLILEIEPGAKSTNPHFSQATLDDILDDLCFNYNQHILYSSGFADTLQILIKCLLNDIKKGDHHDPTNKEKKGTSLIDKQRYFLSGLDGVGKKGSLVLLQHKLTPLFVLKSILEATIINDKNGKPKSTDFDVPGFNVKFILANLPILNTISTEIQTFLDQQKEGIKHE